MLMILTYIADIDKMFEWTCAQGHKIEGQGQICTYLKILEKLIKKSTDISMLMILAHIININKTFKLT